MKSRWVVSNAVTRVPGHADHDLQSMILAIIRLGADLEKVVSQLKEAPQQVFSKDNALNIDHFMTDSGDADIKEEPTPTPHISSEQSTMSGITRGRIA